MAESNLAEQKFCLLLALNKKSCNPCLLTHGVSSFFI